MEAMKMMEGSVDAERDAEKILRICWARKDGRIRFPVDPIAIAGKLGVKVFTVETDPRISGMLFMMAGQDPEIYLNASDSYNQQRCTCAHELGQWYRHIAAGVDVGQVVDYRGSLTSGEAGPPESYAKEFAATLLMPEEKVRRLTDRGYGPAALADKLRVTPDAASYRLKNLSIVDGSLGTASTRSPRWWQRSRAPRNNAGGLEL